MQKTSQKRSILNKLREMTNVSGIAAEKFFNPQFQEVMENLRKVDDAIRAIAVGETVGDSGPGDDPISLKDLLKSAKTNFNRREYMTAVAELGRFHKKFFDIITHLKNLNVKVNEVHHQFLFQDLGDEHKKNLQELKKRWATAQNNSFIKEADIMDFFYNIGTKRGRALAFYEKRFPKEIGKLKKDTANIISRSEAMLSNFISSLKEMATARSARNIDNYVKSSDKIEKLYHNYDEQFKRYYNDNIKNFLEKIMVEEPAPVTESKDPQNIVITPPPSSPGSVRPLSETEYAPPSEKNYQVNIPGPPKTPTNIGIIPPPPAPITTPDLEPKLFDEDEDSENDEGDDKSETLIGYTRKKSHLHFMKLLNDMSHENPLILANYINKYAKSIQNKDPKIAIELFQIVKSIKDQ